MTDMTVTVSCERANDRTHRSTVAHEARVPTFTQFSQYSTTFLNVVFVTTQTVKVGSPYSIIPRVYGSGADPGSWQSACR